MIRGREMTASASSLTGCGRGNEEDEAKIDEWLKDIAPSDTFRRWFAHDPDKWPAFLEKYKRELKNKKEIVNRLRNEAKNGKITLLFSAKDREHNNAVALKLMTEHHE